LIAATCIACADGMYSPGNASCCSHCPSTCSSYSFPDASLLALAGFVLASEEYNHCPAASYSPAGDGACLFWDDGTYSAAGASNCSACPQVCTTCTNENTCHTCKLGFGMVGASCMQWQANYFSAGGNSGCDQCETGYYSASEAGLLSIAPGKLLLLLHRERVCNVYPRLWAGRELLAEIPRRWRMRWVVSFHVLTVQLTGTL
jgi:hypothetical protein